MHCSSVAAVLQSLHQASEADESTPNFIEADPQKEKHMNQSNMGQNNIFLKKERDSSSDSFSDKNNCNSSLTESKHRGSSKMSQISRDHHRQKVQARRLSPSPDFRTVHAKRITKKRKIDSDLASTYSSGDNRDQKIGYVRKSSSSPNSSVRRSLHSRRVTKRKRDSDLTSSIEGIYRQRNSSKKSRQSRDHHRQSSYQKFARQSPDYTVKARFRRRTRRDSSDSSSEYEYTSRNSFKKSRQNRDHHRQRSESLYQKSGRRSRRDSSNSSSEYKNDSRTAELQVRRRRDSSSEFSDSSTVIARKQVRTWLNYNNFNEIPHEFEESFTKDKNCTDEETFETNFDLDEEESYYLKDTKNDSGYNSNQSDVHYKEDKEQIGLKQGNLRPIIIDGANIGHQAGRNRFSAKGYKIVYDHFKKEYGYPDDKIVIVHKHVPSEHLLDEDWAIIDDFKQKGILFSSPSRIVGDGETLIQSDDDVFCLKIAHTYGGIGKKYFHFLIKSLRRSGSYHLDRESNDEFSAECLL